MEQEEKMNREDAEKHWEYTEKIILETLKITKICYIEAMIHGAKHERDYWEKIINKKD
jgi:hypothetical protein